ncbi:MAG: mucoidy inhibitor MuiA family protein [Planctomycetota bacterium]
MMSAALCLVLFAASAPQADADGATSVDSSIADVTVYGSAALVRRTATLPAGGGAFALRGLPAGLDRDALRVRCEGAEILGVELRDRLRQDAPEARLEELRGRVRALETELEVLVDQDHVLARMEQHLTTLFHQEERAHASDVASGSVQAAAWGERLEWLTERSQQTRTARRELGWRIDDARVVLEDARAQLGRVQPGSGVAVLDLVLDVADTTGADASLEVEYLAGNAGWEPHYDLRARRDLSAVELVYRARVWQRTGEDWSDVDVLLSTAQPRRGARGPEPRTVWLDVATPERKKRGRVAFAEAPREQAAGLEQLRGLGYTYAAEVLDEGLSVRYRLPRRETIESSDQPTTVLVGRADLGVAPEHVCVPELDTTVWLRAETTNTSEWVLLPGRAAVYFGADFLGHSQLDAVQPGAELTLHLGADPGLTVERIALEDTTEEAGLFSSRSTLRRRWRFRVRNNGGFTRDADGAVSVVLHEAVPRSTDERVEVEIERAEPKLAEGGRWKTLREERGVVTWVVRVARGAERRVELETAISYPEDLELVLPQ